MNKIKKIFKNSLISAWILSYACLILIIVATFYFSYLQTHEIVSDEIIRANDVMLTQIKDSIDETINTIEQYVGTMPLNERIVKMSKQTQKKLDAAQTYELTKIMKDLSMLSVTTKNFQDSYIYFENLDIVVTSTSIMDTKTFYTAYEMSKDMSYETWISIISNDSKQKFTRIGDIKNPLFIYVSKMPLSFGNEVANTSVVITIKSEKFFTQARKVKDINSSMIAMVDYENHFIPSDIWNDDFSIAYDELDGDKGILSKKTGNKTYVVSYISSSYWNVKYVLAMPYGVFWQKLSYVTTINIAGILLLLLLCILITAYFVKKNYDPIGNLVRQLEKYKISPTPFDYDISEYKYINTAVSTMISEKERLTEHFESQSEYQKNQLIVRMLTSSGESTVPIHEALSMYGIDFPTDEFSVMLFYVEDMNNLFSDDDELNFEERHKIISFIFKNVIEEMVSQNNQGYVIEINGCFTCLINYKERMNKQDRMNEILRIYKEAKQFFMEQFNLTFLFSASHVHQTMMGVHQAYQEAVSVMDYKLIMGTQEAIFIDEIGEVAKTGDYYYPFEQEQMILNAIRIGDYTKTMELVNDILDRNLIQIVPSMLLARCLIYDLVGTIIKAVKGAKEENDDFLECLEPLKHIEMCETIHEMITTTENLIYDVCNYMSGRNSSKHSLKVRVTNYIDENYTDINLSVSKIAEHLGLNAAYVSVAYKEQAGIGILEYINKKRIEKSVEILKNQNIKIIEVAQLVGYVNTQSFNRTFKKILGITPAQFRESI